MESPNSRCVVCLREFSARRLFCSTACERQFYLMQVFVRRDQARWRKCLHCGRSWKASRLDARYCSGRCRIAALRARRNVCGKLPVTMTCPALGTA